MPQIPSYVNTAMGRKMYQSNNFRPYGKMGFLPALLTYGPEAADSVASAGIQVEHTMGRGFSGAWGDGDPTAPPASATPTPWYEKPKYLVPLAGAALIAWAIKSR